MAIFGRQKERAKKNHELTTFWKAKVMWVAWRRRRKSLLRCFCNKIILNNNN